MVGCAPLVTHRRTTVDVATLGYARSSGLGRQSRYCWIVRRHLWRLLDLDVPDVRVVSYRELDPGVRIEPVGRIAVGKAPAAPVAKPSVRA